MLSRAFRDHLTDFIAKHEELSTKFTSEDIQTLTQSSKVADIIKILESKYNGDNLNKLISTIKDAYAIQYNEFLEYAKEVIFEKKSAIEKSLHDLADSNVTNKSAPARDIKINLMQMGGNIGNFSQVFSENEVPEISYHALKKLENDFEALGRERNIQSIIKITTLTLDGKTEIIPSYPTKPKPDQAYRNAMKQLINKPEDLNEFLSLLDKNRDMYIKDMATQLRTLESNISFIEDGDEEINLINSVKKSVKNIKTLINNTSQAHLEAAPELFKIAKVILEKGVSAIKTIENKNTIYEEIIDDKNKLQSKGADSEEEERYSPSKNL